MDKLAEMEVDVNKDLLTVMLLRSLPETFENFRCAMSSRDELPELERLRIKIAEEYDARREVSKGGVQNAMYVRKTEHSANNDKYSNARSEPPKRDWKLKCFKCNKVGHKAKFCKKTKSSKESASTAEKVCLLTTAVVSTNKSFQVNGTSRNNNWCFDSGSTSHMCRDKTSFIDIIENQNLGKVSLASNAHANIFGKGIAKIVTEVRSDTKIVELSDTLFVPDLRTNLISISRITDAGHNVTFSANRAKVLDRDGNVLIEAIRENGLYYLQCSNNPECKISESTVSSRNPKENSIEDWHIRMGHLNIKFLKEAVKSGSVLGINLSGKDDFSECRVCLQGKMCRPSFPKESKRVTVPCELIHSDICGPMRVESNGKNLYFITFIDDASRWCEIRFIKRKSEAIIEYEKFLALVRTQRGQTVKCVQTDNGREYENLGFNQLLEKHGITRRMTAPYNPEQNGIAERRNRTLMDIARCLLIQSGLPASFWAEAVNTANFLHNRSPVSKLDGVTPYQSWHGSPPDVSNLKVFGSEVYVMYRSPGKGKLEPKSREGIFVGYSNESKAYKIWIPKERKFEISRDVKFVNKGSPPSSENVEDPFLETNSSSGFQNSLDNVNERPIVEMDLCGNSDSNVPTDEDLEPVEYSDDEDDFLGFPNQQPLPPDEAILPNNLENPTRRGRSRIVRTGRPGRPRKVRTADCNLTEADVDIALMTEIPVKKALTSPESYEWMLAMAEEVESILLKDTWNLEDRSGTSEVIGSRFILREKFGVDGQLERRKARIVAKGYSQEYGKDFHETYAPVARLSSIRTAIALAAQEGMNIHQYDVTTAYLNGELEERVFMEVPDQLEKVLSFIVERNSGERRIVEMAMTMLKTLKSGNKICRMKKALYGLKQAGRAWYKLFDRVLRDLGLNPTKSDPCVYVGHARSKDVIIVVVYVDDILVMSRDSEEVNQFGLSLGKIFEIKDVGDLKHCLGMNFTKNEKGIFINQKDYILATLRRFNMENCNTVSTPLDCGAKLISGEVWSDEDGEKPPYRELVGCLLYLSIASRPDISHAASKLGQFNDRFNKSHWMAGKRVLRYLKGTADHGIFYSYEKNNLVGYVDADWAGCSDDRRSYTGYCFMMNGGVISWDSKKQRTVALSTTEAEYMAMGEASKEAIYLKRFLRELGQFDLKTIKIHVDNLSAQRLATFPVFHGRTKHIDVRHHFVREVVETGQIHLEHVASDDMTADVFTKGLAKPKHQKCTSLLGLRKMEADKSKVVSRGSVG